VIHKSFSSSSLILFFILAVVTFGCGGGSGDGGAEPEVTPEIPIKHVALIGHSHIDLAWKWTWCEAVQICKNTFDSTLRLLDEYPEFRFSQSSAQAYAWMETFHPEIFERIREKIEAGQWEIVGGAWVESDTNLVSGESLVRQMLYGKRYFLETFGVDVKVGWLPDVFGYSWQLPQILKRSGIERFAYHKTTWNDTHKPRCNFFHWEAPDGSRLFSYLTAGHYCDPVFRGLVDERWATMKEHHPDRNLLPYMVGIGDHGGGVPEIFINEARRLDEDPGYDLTFRRAADVMEEVETEVERIDTIRDELYLEYHRGTYTSRAEVKRDNRRAEVLVETAEKFASLAWDASAYPRVDLKEAWRLTLFNQFHDILPGSSIEAVYEDTREDYQWIFETLGPDEAGSVLDEAFSLLAGEIDTLLPGEPTATPLVLFNPLSWERDAFVTVEAGEEAARVLDPEGGAVPFQQDEAGLSFLARDVPSLGYAVYFVVPGSREGGGASGTTGGQDAGRADIARVDAGGDFLLENEFYRVRINHGTGCVSDILDKRLGRAILDPGREGNLLQIFGDHEPSFPAWNIQYLWGPAYLNNGPLDELAGIEIARNGALEGTVRVRRLASTGSGSAYTQNITLRAGVPLVLFNTHVDWHERYTLLKVGFTFDLANYEMRGVYEIPYGVIDRYHDGTKANWEVPALHWVDVPERSTGCGVTLLNDRKYGFDMHAAHGGGNLNELRMTLLKSSPCPANKLLSGGGPITDVGEFEVNYALHPHAGTWAEADLPRLGDEFNVPVFVVRADSHGGTMTRAFSFMEVSPENVAVTVLKRPEDPGGEAFVVRLVERHGLAVAAEVRFPGLPVARVQEVDLIERDLGGPPLQLTAGRDGFVTPISPYEIRTFRVEIE